MSDDVAARPGLSWLAGRRVTVVGLARSGLAAARLLHAVGARVVGHRHQAAWRRSAEEARELARLGVRLVASGAAATGRSPAPSSSW